MTFQFSEGEADNFRFYLEKRTPVHSRSNSTLNRKRRAELIAKARERKRISTAVRHFFPLLEKYDTNLDGKINNQEFQNIYDHFSEEDRQALFGDLDGSNVVFKRLDKNGNGQVTFQEIIRYIEGRGLAVNQRYLGYKRQDVTSIVSYASSIFDTMLLNLKRLHMEYDDLGRTIGINTGHIETADFDLEEEDIIFLLDQGRNTTIDFLKMYAAKENEK
ncbi:uncharacterized protein LOC117328428 [Pecten maximus]|uniref:uncharacterized protein LOC117328428 n=1 Tax=Pecten maximus TaxID=6579 RepID=UPI001457E8F6|nr:uncharacterized protein LOC117328428 [Pecten maximus]